MIDIETMGNKSFAAIVSIAAVEFDIKTGETKDVFSVDVDLKSSVGCGLKIDPSTVLWWLEQSKEAQDNINKDGESLRSALNKLSKFFVGKENHNVWGNSARFDMGIIENAYSVIGGSIPWKFYNERCVRTLSSLYPDIKKNMVFEGLAHDATDDCKHQIKYCSETYKLLKGI